MAAKKQTAVANYRTSSAANVGPDKDSQRRQAEAVESYTTGRHVIADTFYDAAVSGADPVAERPGFAALLSYCEAHGVGVVLVENASRFAPATLPFNSPGMLSCALAVSSWCQWMPRPTSPTRHLPPKWCVRSWAP